MKKFLLAGAALAAIAAPAAARDHSGYFGIEAGAWFPRDASVRVEPGDRALFDINYKTGVDGDLIMGYDFGMFRAEFEGSHKWAKHDQYDIVGDGTVDARGHTSGFTTMANLLIDLGKDESFNFYAGGGAGLGWFHEREQFGTVQPTIFDIRTKAKFAWQGIAGVRFPAFRYFDVGLKYRYFNMHRLSDGDLRSSLKSHSVLASLIYNFNGPPAPPPPPPPPPAPPPPPPPPPPTPERGY